MSEAETDGGSALAGSLEARGLARSRAHNRHTGRRRSGFVVLSGFKRGVLDLATQQSSDDGLSRN